MKRFRIITQGVNMGVYFGNDQREALEKYAQDAGYNSLDELEDNFKRPKVVEL